ncbi:glycerol-3-phosphate dehydrogenase/oxidase [Microbacterium halotolerans]|uniref:glycerol-3-phosphate dehydrogenase/oxidase n=1 Tax=Microbacterium halotolerans TaxID=246613 RepID=UPI000E6AB52C|nr:glycerol-3-phosphate dehydrogenase/oxidase [Microbacterium halotolerans]
MPSLSTYREHVEDVDVIVIGAGINGLATAREAAALGMSVLLIDQDDIGSRTTAISTRLIHGGLKYLERMELHLVHESIRERDILLAQAPHLVHRYPMLIPFAKKQSRPGWLLACGLMVFNALSLTSKLPLSGVILPRRLAREWPSVTESGVKWGGLFQDANVPLTERLTFELASDVDRRGGTVLTHAPVESLVRDGDRIAGVRYRDRVDGALKTVRARAVVNAAGPWVDAVLDLLGEHERRIGPTKGSHCVVDSFPGAPETCIFFESPVDHRPMFVLPWQGRYMIGTTDLPYDGSIDEMSIDSDETDYLLGAVNDLIPRARLEQQDVLWSYSGVRPLPYVGELDDPSKISRDHQLIAHDGADSGLFTIIGGKLTTHRALGEQVARVVARALGRKRMPSPTRSARFPGAPAGSWPEYRSTQIRDCALPEAIAARIVDTYGVASADVFSLVRAHPELGEILDEDTSAIAAEVVHARRNEGAHTLEDVLLRRTLIGTNADVGLAAAPRAAAVLVEAGEWTREEADAQIEKYRRAVRRFTPRALAQSSSE